MNFVCILSLFSKVKRQDEPQLVKAVRELCDGEPSAETNILLKSLDRPLKNNDAKPVMLFGVNFDVDFMNQDKLDAMQGLPKIYRAVDSGLLFELSFIIRLFYGQVIRRKKIAVFPLTC